MARGLTEDEKIRELIGGVSGGLEGLTTSDKTSLVAAINEILTITGTGIKIDDLIISSTKTWSSSKIDSTIDSSIAALVDASPSTLNTLNELAAALGDDPNFATTVTNLIAEKAPKVNPVFSGSVTVPNNSFPISKTTGLQSELDSKLETVPAATTSIAGIVEKATTLEASTGTDNLRYITPLLLKQEVGTWELGYRGMLETDAPNLYPKGYSVMLASTADGWPAIAGNFRNVVTFSGSFNSGTVVQYAHPYQTSGQTSLIRTAASSTTWNPWGPA